MGFTRNGQVKVVRDPVLLIRVGDLAGILLGKKRKKGPEQVTPPPRPDRPMGSKENT